MIKKILFFLIIPSVIFSHPHVWISASVELNTLDNRAINEITEVWKFDSFFSSNIITEYDIDKDGKFTGSELKKLVDETFTYISEYNYFTDIRVNGKKVKLKKLKEFNAFIEDDVIVYRFTLELAHTIDIVNNKIDIGIFDDEYYVEYSYTDKPVKLFGMDGECKVDIYKDDKNKIYYGMVSPLRIKLCN